MSELSQISFILLGIALVSISITEYKWHKKFGLQSQSFRKVEID